MSTPKKKRARKTQSQQEVTRGQVLRTEGFAALAAELQQLRDYQPLKHRPDGAYEGDILGFVKGLRLSAKLAYILREQLSVHDVEVNWGHLLDKEERSCSRECDIIVHRKGHIRRWNGNERPIMDFVFVPVDSARAVISCKSLMKSIDKNYAKDLRQFGVKHVFLFAECCDQRSFEALTAKAKAAGYKGLCCLYLTSPDSSFVNSDEGSYIRFMNSLLKAVE